MTTKFDGQAVIKVRFQFQPQYKKFREQILKTKWIPGDVWPTWEEMVMDFHNVDDLDKVTRTIVMLLQHGFEVYSTRFKLEQQLAEEEHPTEEDILNEEIAGVDPIYDKLGNVTGVVLNRRNSYCDCEASEWSNESK